jgi:hypothetical protein
MTTKMVFLFTMSVILTSFSVMVIPQASALNQKTIYHDFTPLTARYFTEVNVCGTHMCGPGELTKWQQQVWNHGNQFQGTTSMTHHVKTGMHTMASSATGSTTMPGNMNMGTK